MTWVLAYGDAVLATGSYASMLDEAEERQILARGFGKDGIDLPPRWRERGYVIVPEAMLPALIRRRAAA